jgi:hypothetical protein
MSALIGMNIQVSFKDFYTNLVKGVVDKVLGIGISDDNEVSSTCFTLMFRISEFPLMWHEGVAVVPVHLQVVVTWQLGGAVVEGVAPRCNV